jgi:hypothetical protein
MIKDFELLQIASIEDAQPDVRQGDSQELPLDPLLPGLKPGVCASEAQLPLLTVVSLIQSKKFGAQTIRNLGGTTPLAHHLKALSDLWQSLGRPQNIFWRSSLVYYNRIVDAPDSDKA